jgi:hypothetical protein
MSKSNVLKAACLGASLATAWAATKAEAADFFVHASGTLTLSMSTVTFMVGGQSIPVPNDASGISALSPSPGTSLPSWAGTIVLNMPDNFTSQPWVMVGGGTGTLANDVIVAGFAGTLVLNQAFEDVFKGYTEGTLVDAIIKRNNASINAFLSAFNSEGQMPGLESPAVMFSNGTQIGSLALNVTPAVPEPGSLSLLAVAVGGLLRRFRRSAQR